MAILRFPLQLLQSPLTNSDDVTIINQENYLDHLKQADIFNQLTNTQLEMILKICDEEWYRMNEVIFSEGTANDKFYIIIQGEVDVLVDPIWINGDANMNHSQATISRLTRGQSFGELALVDKGLRTATARAVKNNTLLLVIPSKILLTLCKEFPQLGFRVMKNLATDLAIKFYNPPPHIDFTKP